MDISSPAFAGEDFFAPRAGGIAASPASTHARIRSNSGPAISPVGHDGCVASGMGTSLTRFLADESGVTAIEYGLVAGLISLVILAATDDAGLRVRAVLRFVAFILDPGQAKLVH